MDTVRVISDEEMRRFIDIVAEAYPGFEIGVGEERDKIAERLNAGRKKDPTVDAYGLFRDGEMLGGMRLFDFRMQMFEQVIPATGIGLLAVDLCHKKEHVARELMRYYLQESHDRGANMALLYPFRPDFYRQMGFGLGSPMHQYSFRPESLPRREGKSHVQQLTPADAPAMLDCYHRVMARTHGLMAWGLRGVERLLEAGEKQVVGYKSAGMVRGFMIYRFVKGASFVRNDMELSEPIYETPEVLSELLAFLHSQADQIDRVVVNSQDDFLHFVPVDPRNRTEKMIPSVYHETRASGVGLMYRVIDVARLFEELAEHRFGADLKLRLHIEDSFFPSNDGELVVHFVDGRPRVVRGGPSEVQVTLDVAEFSSLLMGCVPFRSLYMYGVAQVSNPAYVEALDRLFAVRRPPVCTTEF